MIRKRQGWNLAAVPSTLMPTKGQKCQNVLLFGYIEQLPVVLTVSFEGL
jgi:hypothetical protein